MNISIFGLGYVGAVSAGCLARQGHHVIGVDANALKVQLVQQGLSPIVEPGLDALIAQHVASGRIAATANCDQAVADSDLSLVCVATPSQTNGALDLSAIRRVCEQIGAALRHKRTGHLVAIRSSVLPGTLASVVIPTLEAHSGCREGVDFHVLCHPEFLREGSALEDFFNPPKIVIGEASAGAGDALAALYAQFPLPVTRTALNVAEMVKYCDNAWHALKVAFANEVGTLAAAMGVPVQPVMDIFCADTKLNISAAYLRPGFAFGGSCLPKDVRALDCQARHLDLALPVLSAILPSNAAHLRQCIQLIMAGGKRRIGVLGFAFKAGTDDLRESPMVEVVEHLLGKGYELRLYDRNVHLAALHGTNRDYIDQHVPHVSALCVATPEELLDFAQTLVIGNRAAEFAPLLHQLRADQDVIDLVHIAHPELGARYRGLAW